MPGTAGLPIRASGKSRTFHQTATTTKTPSAVHTHFEILLAVGARGGWACDESDGLALGCAVIRSPD